MDEFIKNSNITQIYISESLIHLERIKKIFNLTEYVCKHKPLLVFGMYSIDDFNILNNHIGNKYVVWGGSDCDLSFPHTLSIIKKIINLRNVVHISISKDIQSRLHKMRIPSHRIDLNLVDTTIFKPTNSLKKSVFVYNGYKKGSEHIYGKDIYEKVIEEIHKINPNIYFIFSNELNLPYEEMPNIYKLCCIGLRLTKHDGNANTVQEFHAMNIPIVHNGEYDHTLKYKSVQDIVFHIIKCYRYSIEMQKKILVTGGCGFIGSNLCDHLIELGHKVRVIDNLSTGNMNNIEHLLNNPNFELVVDDITNIEAVRKVCDGVDIICNLGALGSVVRSVEDPLTSHNNNVNGFLNVIVVAKELKIKRVVYASSSAVYGDEPNLPKKEERIGKPLSPYGITKYVNELYGNIFYTLYGLECIGMRFFNVFGKRQNPNSIYSAVIPKFIDHIKRGERPVINGDGMYSRDFTHIENILQALSLAMFTTNEKCYGQVFNVGASSRTTIIDMYKMIAKHMKSDLEPIYGPFRVGDIPHSNADVTKAIELLGYDPHVDFETGIVKTVEYFTKK